MKANRITAAVLVLLGTSVLTYTTTRYLTTERVLAAAEKRLNDGLHREGLYEVVFPPNDERITRIVPTVSNAIRNAGGAYYWWNDALAYWAAGGVLVIAGLLSTQLRLRKHES